MINGAKTVLLFSISGATGTAATEFRGVDPGKPLSSSSSVAGAPLTSQNAPKAFLGEGMLHNNLHNYDRKWELDLISLRYLFLQPRVFRFSLIKFYQIVE